MKYIVLIPSYEPDDKLIELLKSIPKEMNIVVVNDGSNESYDGVFKLAKKYGHVIAYKENKGKGYALKTGLKYIKDNYQDYIVCTMDGDLQHDISDAMKLMKYANIHNKVLVLGRRTWNKKTPIRSRIGNMITRYVFYLKTGLKIYDTQTGLRAFSNNLTDYLLSIDGDRYEYEMNALLNLRENGIGYHEIPIKTIYINKNETSHFKTIKDSYKIYKEIFKYKKTR